MKFDFHIGELSFAVIKKIASVFAEMTNAGELIVQNMLSPAGNNKKFGKGIQQKESLELLSINDGEDRLHNSNGLFISSMKYKKWEFYVFKMKVKNESFWVISISFDEHLLPDKKIIDAFLFFIGELNPALAMGFDSAMRNFDIRYYTNMMGIWAGLRDVYWLNYYGKEFAELIGRDRLMRLNCFERIELINDGIFFVINEKSLSNSKSIINDIGNDFFIVKELEIGVEQKIGIIALFSTLYRLWKNDDSEKEYAKKRPFKQKEKF